MSEIEDAKWLEDSIAGDHIKLYKYSDFRTVKQLGSGSYGRVILVEQKDCYFALKSFNNNEQTQVLREIVRELQLHRHVSDHDNIIRFYGVAKVGVEYSLVLEYADSGTLNTYLGKHFNKLDWNDKYHLALQLARAVEHLHEEDIIHRDLHGKNILIHQKKIKLADFGLSRKIEASSSASSASKIFGVLPFVDPEKFENRNYKLTKESDVYSIGVLLWQISSGYEPFCGVDYDTSLALSILKGEREKIIDGTPIKYSNLYNECWKREPAKRPNIQGIVSTLKSIISPVEIGTTSIDDIDEKKEIHSSEETNSELKLSKGTIDLNNELTSNDGLNISESNKVTVNLNNELFLSNDELKIVRRENEMSLQSQNHVNGLSSASQITIWNQKPGDQDYFTTIGDAKTGSSKTPNSHIAITNLPLRIPENMFDSSIITLKQSLLISSWIDYKDDSLIYTSQQESPHNLILLLRGNRDGFGVEEFREKVFNQGPTIVVINLVRSQNIIGGYNPLDWTGSNKFVQSSDSFIFSFRPGKKSSISTLSRVSDEKSAISDDDGHYIGFGHGDLYIFQSVCQKRDYMYPIHELPSFQMFNYEVFKVVKKEI